MFEASCEPFGTCNNDQYSFKAYLARWLSKSAVVYPAITDSIAQRLRASALAAAQACTGPSATQNCGQKWYTGGYDGSFGVGKQTPHSVHLTTITKQSTGQQMSALETVQSLLLLNETWSPRREPRTEPNVTIQVVPVMSTFPLNPPKETSNSGVTGGGSSDHTSRSSGTRTNIPGTSRTNTKSTSTSQGLAVLKTWAVLATPVVLVVAFGGLVLV